VSAARRIAVAVSGGRDSTALWHATARAAAASGQTIEVVGLHVHHGLQAQADDWLAHLRRQARRWRGSGLPVTLQWRVLQTRPARGDSVEAWARRERYTALGDMAREAGIDAVMLAHHQRDQAETFLLQALRGAGPAGLAAMPRVADKDGIKWLRPWLAQPSQAIDSYVRRFRLGHIEDPSNARHEHARSRLRLELWPVLDKHFDRAAQCLAASAARAHEAAECMHELASIDLQALCTTDDALALDPWRKLPQARRSNALRAWLAQRLDGGVPERLVQRLLLELPRVKVARWPVGADELRLHDGHLRLSEATMLAPRPLPHWLDLSQPGEHPVDEWGGIFEVRLTSGPGLAPQQLRDCELRARSGGERFQAAPASLPRSLKKQYQSARVPAWGRSGPLVYGDGQLLFVPGLGIDARRHAAPATPALQLRWVAQPKRAVVGR
jgi:tRNA(Ile)-lysidine synthase